MYVNVDVVELITEMEEAHVSECITYTHADAQGLNLMKTKLRHSKKNSNRLKKGEGMIVKKAWKQIKRIDEHTTNRYIWHGWFLFGIIPVYLVRVSLD
jgi:hypothetical protein